MKKGKDRGFIVYDIFHVYYKNYVVVMEQRRLPYLTLYINPQCLKNPYHVTDLTSLFTKCKAIFVHLCLLNFIE